AREKAAFRWPIWLSDGDASSAQGAPRSKREQRERGEECCAAERGSGSGSAPERQEYPYAAARRREVDPADVLAPGKTHEEAVRGDVPAGAHRRKVDPADVLSPRKARQVSLPVIEDAGGRGAQVDPADVLRPDETGEGRRGHGHARPLRRGEVEPADILAPGKLVGRVDVRSVCDALSAAGRQRHP